MGWFGITPFGIFGGNRNNDNNSSSQQSSQQTTRVVHRPTAEFARRPIHNAMDWLVRTWQDTASGFNRLLGINDRDTRRNDTPSNREANNTMLDTFRGLTNSLARIRGQEDYSNAISHYEKDMEKYKRQLAHYEALPENRRHGEPPKPPTKPSRSEYIRHHNY